MLCAPILFLPFLTSSCTLPSCSQNSLCEPSQAGSLDFQAVWSALSLVGARCGQLYSAMQAERSQVGAGGCAPEALVLLLLDQHWDLCLHYILTAASQRVHAPLLCRDFSDLCTLLRAHKCNPLLSFPPLC